MVATVVVKELNGAGPAYTTVDNSSNKARYKTKDEVTSDLNYPCIVPAVATTHYSYWKSHSLDLSATFTRVNNVRWYPATVSWTCGTGGGLFVAQRATGDHGCPDGSYDQAGGTEGTTGDYVFDASTGHAYFKASGGGATPVLATTYTSGSMMTVDSGNHDAAEMTKHVVTQVVLKSDATQGLQSAVTVTFVYDEI